MTETHGASGIALDQEVALRQAAAKLESEFTGVFAAETIERFLYSSYDQFASRATIVQFLPLLPERFARQRLQALAKVEGLRALGGARMQTQISRCFPASARRDSNARQTSEVEHAVVVSIVSPENCWHPLPECGIRLTSPKDAQPRRGPQKATRSSPR